MQSELLNFYINELYKNGLFSQKIIAESLGIWNDFSDEEKLFYESITQRDADVNGFFSKKEFDEKHTYGEITKSAVNTIYQSLEKITDLKNKTFYDLGSGNGKIILHLALISELGKINGIEISPIRIAYSNHLMLKFLPEFLHTKVNFIQNDFFELDISDGDIFFINDICLHSMTPQIFDKMKSGSFLISSLKSIKEYTPVVEIPLNVTWTNRAVNYYIFKK
jgi:SAM-dependent methyltransferase